MVDLQFEMQVGRAYLRFFFAPFISVQRGFKVIKGQTTNV